MAVETTVALSPIMDADVDRVARFLHDHLNTRLSASVWAAAMVPRWRDDAPNRGFMLTAGADVVGVSLAFYATRDIDGRDERFCNLAALCVREDMRRHTFRLLRALLKQPGYHFTDLSPSGTVVELDLRLGLQPIDTTTAVLLNLPRLARGGTLVTDPDKIDLLLGGEARELYRDHREALAARHLLIVKGGRSCHVVYRRDRRKKLPLFATLLHVSDPELYRDEFGVVALHLLREGLPLTLAELRLLGPHVPARPRVVVAGRPKMFKSHTLGPDQIGYLYSELACVPW